MNVGRDCPSRARTDPGGRDRHALVLIERDPDRRNYEFMPNMVESVARDAQSPPLVLADGTAVDMRVPRGSVARGHIPLEFAATPEGALLAGQKLHQPDWRGRRRGDLPRCLRLRNVLCSSCHGAAGLGDGTGHQARRSATPVVSRLECSQHDVRRTDVPRDHAGPGQHGLLRVATPAGRSLEGDPLRPHHSGGGTMSRSTLPGAIGDGIGRLTDGHRRRTGAHLAQLAGDGRFRPRRFAGRHAVSRLHLCHERRLEHDPQATRRGAGLNPSSGSGADSADDGRQQCALRMDACGCRGSGHAAAGQVRLAQSVVLPDANGALSRRLDALPARPAECLAPPGQRRRKPGHAAQHRTRLLLHRSPSS